MWTIPAEAWCYAAAALLAATTIMRRPLLFAIVPIVALIACPHFPQSMQAWLPSGGGGTIPALVFIFLFGALLHVCGRLIPLSLALAFAVIGALVLSIRTPLFGYLYYAGIAYVALVLAYHPRLCWRPYLRVGDYSYGTYVLAFPVQQFLVWRFGIAQPLALFALAALSTLPLAMLSWHVVEEPALAMKTRLAAWRPHVTQALRSTTRS